MQCKRTSGKINVVVEDCVALDAVAKRQKSWLERGDGTAPVAWRPVKLGRQGARAWLTAIDNKLKTSTCCRGLVDFNWTAEWGDHWPTWRGLGVSIDLGSDGVSAWHAMVYHWRINSWLFPDESHSCKNSFFRCCGRWACTTCGYCC